ncbi:hypothetical protein BN903_21 [Halorubrum sp. AJ67]|nr:hypothetical protein BN903_21 [Halorubrum sp. AJ67]
MSAEPDAPPRDRRFDPAFGDDRSAIPDATRQFIRVTVVRMGTNDARHSRSFGG